MADKLQVSLPEAGETVEYHFSPDVPVKFTFFVSEVVFSCDGNDLILTGENGGAVVIRDYQAQANAGALPEFELHGGETVPGDIYLFAFSGAGLDIETAAGSEEEMAGEGGDPVMPEQGLDPLDVPEAGGAEDHSSLVSPVAGEVLAFDAVLPETVGEAALPGVSVFGFEGGTALGFLSDVHDSLADAVQHIIDSPEYC